MALRGVSASAVAYIARRDETTACNGLCRFTHNHAVHDDEVARLHVDEREFVLGGNVFGDGTGSGAEGDCGSGRKWNQGDKDVIARIDLKNGIGHEDGSLMGVADNLSLPRIALRDRSMDAARLSSRVRRKCGERIWE
jgi:hypothetical protein